MHFPRFLRTDAHNVRKTPVQRGGGPLRGPSFLKFQNAKPQALSGLPRVQGGAKRPLGPECTKPPARRLLKPADRPSRPIGRLTNASIETRYGDRKAGLAHGPEGLLSRRHALRAIESRKIRKNRCPKSFFWRTGVWKRFCTIFG